MAARKAADRGSARNGESPVLETLAALNGPLVEQVDWTNMAWLKSLCSLQEETLRFVSHRLERDTEMVEEYQHSKTAIDRITLQQKWLAGLGQDLLQEGLQLGKLMRNIMANNATEFAEVATLAGRRSISSERAGAASSAE